jgi:hypothetical protein
LYGGDSEQSKEEVVNQHGKDEPISYESILRFYLQELTTRKISTEKVSMRKISTEKVSMRKISTKKVSTGRISTKKTSTKRIPTLIPWP